MTLAQPLWQTISTAPALSSGEVHVWAVIIRSDAGLLADCLSEEERAQTGRFLQAADRHRAFISRAFRRVVLARYLDLPPETLEFTVSEYGKPALSGANSWLSFNVSHSRDLVALAVTVSKEVGIDVEFTRDNLRMDEIAARFLPKEAAALIASTEGAAKAERFFSVWTETEATLKARGLGLAKGLGSLAKGDCAVRHFRPAPGYIGAVATGNPSSQLQFFKWATQG